MKGTIKALKRAPQSLGSRVGMSTKSQDAEFSELNRKVRLTLIRVVPLLILF